MYVFALKINEKRSTRKRNRNKEINIRTLNKKYILGYKKTKEKKNEFTINKVEKL